MSLYSGLKLQYFNKNCKLKDFLHVCTMKTDAILHVYYRHDQWAISVSLKQMYNLN